MEIKYRLYQLLFYFQFKGKSGKAKEEQLRGLILVRTRFYGY
jgi:hypothetical protein